jgi:putative ABC transport system permease protein
MALIRLLPDFANDVRFALRQISRTPLFSGVVIAVIALGIGTNAGLFTTLDTYAWRAAPGIEDTPRLARLTATAVRGPSGQVGPVSLSYSDIQDLRGQREVFADVAAWQATSLAADFGDGAASVMASYTTANYFRVLGVVMAAGAGFSDGADHSPDAMVIIGHSLWQTRLGGRADAIGKTIRVMNQPFTIVGVAPPRFAGVNVSSMGRDAIWIPLGARALLEADANVLGRRDAMSLLGVARLAPGVSAGAVTSMTAAFAASVAREDSATHRGFAIRAERLTGMARGRGDTTETIAAFVLIGALIVLITCTNVSALLLGRAVARRREIGVRLSLGATRLRIVRQMLTESLVLASAGALLGLLLYVIVVKLAYATIPEVIYGLQPKPATFAFAAMFALITTIACGLAPALHASRAGIAEVIKGGGNLSAHRSRLQALFVVIQLACSQPVLIVTSLVLADLRAGANDGALLAPASVVTMSSEVFRSPIQGQSALAARDSAGVAAGSVLRRVRRRLDDLPGVLSAAISARGGRATFEATTATGDRIITELAQLNVSADWFSTLGIPILRGRAIGADEDAGGSVTIVVSEDVARRLWPGEDPIGKRLLRRPRVVDPTDGRRIQGASLVEAAISFEVIGVAGAAPFEDETAVPRVFMPLSSAGMVWVSTIAVRSTGPDARALVPGIRSAIREVDPLATIGDVATLADQYALRQRETALSHGAAFGIGAAALLLASLGLYALIAFAVAQRTREIGVRLAMGATPGDVVRHFFRHGLLVTAVAVAIGLPVTIAGIRIVEANLIGFTVQNVTSVMLVVPVLILIAAVASWLPARRAARVDPLVALRSE